MLATCNFNYISILLLPAVIAQTGSLGTPTPTIQPALLQTFDGVTASPDEISSELIAYSRHMTLFGAYHAFTQDVAHFITGPWPTNPPAALSSLYASWTANDEHVPDFYTAAVSYFESVTRVNEAISMGLIGPSQFSFVVSYVYTPPLQPSNFFPPDDLRKNMATPTTGTESRVSEEGGLGLAGVFTTSGATVPTNTLTLYGSPLFLTNVPNSLTSIPGLVPVLTSGQSRTGAEGRHPTALPVLGTWDPFGNNELDVNGGQPSSPITPVNTGSVPGFASFTTGQVQTRGGEGDVSAIFGTGSSLTGTAFTIFDGPSSFPTIQPGTIIEPIPTFTPGQVQTQTQEGSSSGIFFIETGAGFTIFDAPDLTAPITLLDGTKTQRIPGVLVTQMVTVTVSILANTTQMTVSSSVTTISSTPASPLAATTFSAAAGAPARVLGLTHPKVMSRLGATVVGYAGLILGFWMD